MDQFWELTYKELCVYTDAYTEKEEMSYKQTSYGSWLSAALQRQKKLVTLEQLLKPNKKEIPKEELQKQHDDIVKRLL